MASNKAADFEVLKTASSALAEYMRMDENSPDLLDRLTASEPGSHRYLTEPFLTQFPLQMFSASKFTPLPSSISSSFRDIECASFMGLLPEVNRAWITVDNKLYVWDYLHPSNFIVYNDIPEVIISVSLSAPKASVFSDLVKYILVVATPVQVYLLAFVWEADLSLLKIESTSFSVPSDSVTMLKVAGSQCGRIFMGGNDGNVYELEYQNAEVWSVFGSSRKCRKLNHTAWHWKLIHIVPSIFRELSGWNDSIFDIVVDDQRGLLFSISSKGDLSAFFLGHKKDSLIAIRTHFNIFEEAYHCVLNKPMDFSPKADYLKSGSMKIIGIFVVPVTESRQIHLLLVLSTGIRVYVAVKASDGSHFYREGSEAPPSDLRVIHVRSPPPPEAIVAAASLHAGGVRETSFLPTYLPSQPLSLHTAYYNHGVLLAAMGSENSADKVLGLSDDSKGQLFKEGIAIVAEEGHSNRVYDIREVCHSIHKKEELLLHAGFVISRSSNALADPSSNLLNLFPGCGAPGLALSSTAGSVPGSIVPFPESILQMAPSQGPSRRKLLCLLNGGLLQVNKNRPIDILYRMLETSSQSEEFVDQARAVFLHYGILPSATMCVAIACNSPLDLQAERVEADTNAPDANLGLVQRRALTVLQRLGEPTSFRVSGLIPAVQQDSRFSMSGTTGFVMSTSHDALQLFLSRTLRPLWLKTIVTKSGTLSSLFAPRGIIGAIRMPLINFAAILVNYFGSAIRLDVSSAEQKKRDDDGASSLLVRQLQLQHSHQNNTPSAAAGAAPADQEKALLREAKRREDASILAMYRLATRSIHALSLLDILISAECETKLKVAWVKLQGMNFQALVTETEAHDIVQKMLDAALSTLSPTASVGGVTVNVGDRLTNLLSSHCFLYFSAGDRFRYEASKAIASAVQLKMGGTASLHGYSGGDVGALTGQGINLMRKASRYWRSADDVVTSSCVLKKCCGELALLGALGRDAIVDICIATAANFEDPRDLRAVGTSALLRGEADDSDKERELYHGIGGAGMGPSERETARKACYSCLIDAIKASGSDVKNVLHMVERCINTSKDGTFLTMLFDSLYEWNKDILLSVNSKALEDYLSRKDARLLYSYLEAHHRSREACSLALKLALTEGDPMDISERQHLLSLAASSAASSNDDRAVEIQDRLVVADFQKSILAVLSADLAAIQASGISLNDIQKKEVDELVNLVTSLRTRLKTISELYLQAAEPYKLYDIALQLLFAARADDQALVGRLWRSFIYRLVPDSAEGDTPKLFLQSKRDPQHIDIDQRKQRRDIPFESSSLWLNDLLDQVVALGRSLRGHESDLAFPLVLVLEELEEIALQLVLAEGSGEGGGSRSVQRGCIWRALLRIGLGHDSLMQTYCGILLRRWQGRPIECQIVLMASASACLMDWVHRASGINPSSSNELKLLYLAIRGQRVQSWAKTMLQLTQSVTSVTSLPTPVRTMLSEIQTELAKVDMFINSATIA